MRLFLSILVFCLTLPIMAEESGTRMVLWSKDGTKVAFDFKENPIITINQEELILTTDSTQINYSIVNLDKITYENVIVDGIINLTAQEPIISFNGEMLVFPSIETNSTVSLYRQDGKLVLKKTILQKGEYDIPIHTVEKGLYIVDLNGITYKFLKK